MAATCRLKKYADSFDDAVFEMAQGCWFQGGGVHRAGAQVRVCREQLWTLKRDDDEGIEKGDGWAASRGRARSITQSSTCTN